MVFLGGRVESSALYGLESPLTEMLLDPVQHMGQIQLKC